MARWLLGLMTGASGETASNGAKGFVPPEEFKDGARNEFLYRTARSFHAKFKSNEAEILAMLGGFNESRCKPPVGADELAQIAQNAATQADRPDFKSSAVDPDVERLARLSPIEYDQCREDEAEKLKVRLKTLDEQVRKARNRFERSNGHAGNSTESGASDRSNGCSNEGGVRTPDQIRESAQPVIDAPDVLEMVRAAIVAHGYAGDPLPVVLIYVALTSRLSNKPVNVHVIAPSAAGKNFAINSATRFIPDEGILKLSAMSPKALIHGDDDLRHKTVVLSECDSLANLEGNAATLIRSIIEDAKTDFDVVERNPESGRSITRRISKEGPTGLITSGVRGLELQIATRVLTQQLSDTPAQTREILRAEADIASGRARVPDPESAARLIDFQRWLALQAETAVVIPFAPILAKDVPAGEVRMRRDFKQLLVIIHTVALLNQHHRARDAKGAIVAELADYAWARRLLLSTFKSIVGGGITDAVRETCLAVPEADECSEADLVKLLGLVKSTVHYRVVRALKGGWLSNLEKRRGYAYRLVRGAPLPEDASPLPTIEKLKRAFEQGGDSNGYSNGPEPLGGEGESPTPFESSSRSGGAEEDAEIDRLAQADGWNGVEAEDSEAGIHKEVF